MWVSLPSGPSNPDIRTDTSGGGELKDMRYSWKVKGETGKRLKKKESKNEFILILNKNRLDIWKSIA